MSEADVKAVIAKLKKTEPGLVFGVPGYSSEVQPYVGLEAGRLSLIVSGEVEKLSELQSSEAVEVRTRCTDYGDFLFFGNFQRVGSFRTDDSII